MANVLVICGAGASSSFLVHWLRKQAAARGLAHSFAAGSLDALPTQVTTADAVLLGSHLAESLAQVEATASAVPVILLPAVSFDAAGADTALDLLIATETESTSHA